MNNCDKNFKKGLIIYVLYALALISPYFTSIFYKGSLESILFIMTMIVILISILVLNKKYNLKMYSGKFKRVGML